jgi:hypothetical protein
VVLPPIPLICFLTTVHSRTGPTDFDPSTLALMPAVDCLSRPTDPIVMRTIPIPAITWYGLKARKQLRTIPRRRNPTRCLLLYLPLYQQCLLLYLPLYQQKIPLQLKYHSRSYQQPMLLSSRLHHCPPLENLVFGRPLQARSNRRCPPVAAPVQPVPRNSTSSGKTMDGNFWLALRITTSLLAGGFLAS